MNLALTISSYLLAVVAFVRLWEVLVAPLRRPVRTETPSEALDRIRRSRVG